MIRTCFGSGELSRRPSLFTVSKQNVFLSYFEKPFIVKTGFSFVNLLLSQMSMEELREEACDCLFEIINKGMDPVDKTKLVESLCRVLQSAGFFNVEQVTQNVRTNGIALRK